MNKWLPISTAPRDGTLVLLAIEPGEHPLEDSSGLTRTLGHNNYEGTGEDRWEFAGWCWCHDHYTQGTGEPVAWAPILDAPVRQLAPPGFVE